MPFCPNCGCEVKEGNSFCPACGSALPKNIKGTFQSKDTQNDVKVEVTPERPEETHQTTPKTDPNASSYSALVALLLCIFLGGLGVHRFYVGKVGTGILILLTFGGFFGIIPLIDLIMIIVGSFEDSDGKKVKNWDI